jgi:hypothetical protein
MYSEFININTLKSHVDKLGSKVPLFSNIEWIQLFNKRCKIIAVFNDDGQLIAYIYGLYGKKMGLPYFINAPFTPHCGFFMQHKSSNNANAHTTIKNILTSITDFLYTQNLHWIQFAFPTSTIDMQAFIWEDYLVLTKYTYQLDLNQDTQHLFNNLASEKRKSIRKAESDQIQIKKVTKTDTIQMMLEETFIRNKIKYDKALFKNIISVFANQENSIAYAAYNSEGKLMAATFCLIDNTTCYYLFGGTNQDNPHHGAAVSCMWHSILEAKEKKIKVFDFEGSMLPFIEKYFREFGATLVPYYEVKKQSLITRILKR